MPLYDPAPITGPIPRAGYYYPSSWPSGAAWGGTQSMTGDKVSYIGYNTGPLGFMVERIGVNVTTNIATSVVRIGLYQDTGGGIPGALMIDGGTVSSATTGVKEVVLGTPTYLGANKLYWVAIVCQVAGAVVLATHSNAIKGWCGRSTLDATNGFSCWTQASITGALPSTATVAADPDSAQPGFVLKHV